MRLRPLLSAAAVAVALVVVASANSHWFDMHVPRLARAESGLTLIATRTEIPVGPGARLGVRLVDSSGTAVTEKIVVEVARLDMAPDGMPGMTAALRRVEGSTPGEIAFTGDIAMAGRWALSLSAMVEGRSDPVTGTVVFTAAAPAPSKAAGSAADKGRILYYRHPMGLSDRSSVPKKDSMGMDYIAVYEGDVSEVPGSVRIAPEKVQRAGVRTAVVERRQLSRTIQAPGTVTADESSRDGAPSRHAQRDLFSKPSSSTATSPNRTATSAERCRTPHCTGRHGLTWNGCQALASRAKR